MLLTEFLLACGNPPICSFAFHGFSHQWSTVIHKQIIFRLKVKQQPSAISQYLCYSPHFSTQAFYISHHYKKGEYGTRTYFERPYSFNLYYNKLL